MKPEHKRKLILLIEKERIHFDGPEHVPPEHHANIFGAVKLLSRYRLDEYIHNFTFEADQKPWRAKIKQQVERIVRLADDCRRARQNEFTWRLKLESEILARFATEVTCKSCSSKLWRSEVEVSLNPSDTFGDTLNLGERQANRKPCRCSEMQRFLDHDDPGICRIFHDRAEQPVKYQDDDPLFGALPAEQKPDRVYGFRKTTRFSRLIDEELREPKFEGQELRDAIECSPFNEPRDQVLFPFLILEAKAASGDSFDDIEIQTAFAIKKLLDLQFSLKSANGEESQWQSGPLVWFLSSRGDDWRIAAAYMDMKSHKQHYYVRQLWSGSILAKDAALQLLLIMGYVFDWARDFQREAILNELRIFAGRSSFSVADDSEIRSLGDPMQRFLVIDADETPVESRATLLNASTPYNTVYRWLDSEHCSFRSISWAHARISSLYITKDNLQTLLHSFSSNDVAQKHAEDLLRLFREAWKVSSDALEALEFMWTGTQREDTDLYGATKNFCTVFTVAAYFLSDWEQVTELTYIAIAEDALADLKTYVDLEYPIHAYASEMPTVQHEHLVGYFRYFRQTPTRIRLHAAMRRCCLSSRLAHETDAPENFFLVAEEPFELGVQYRLDVTMMPDRKPKTRQLVAAVYNQCKRGMREPDESFLRTSSTYYNTPWDGQDVPSVWGLDELPMDQEALYILLGSDEAVNNMVTRFCIYIMDDIPAPQAFPLSFESLSSCLMIQCRHCGRRSVTATRWNVDFTTESIQPDQDWSENLRTQFRDSVVQRRAQSESEYDTSPRRSPYHKTREIPPHLRSNRKVPKGHWIITSDPENTYEDFRTATDLLVARKHNAKLITCLFAEPQIPGRAGLRFEQTPGTKTLSPEEQDRKVAELQDTWKRGWEPGADNYPEVGNIIQRGDRLNLPKPFLQRQRDGIVRGVLQQDGLGAGDWFTDEELAESYWLTDVDGNVVLGRATDVTARSEDLGEGTSRKRTREEDSGNAPDRHREHSHKRVRFEKPPDASDVSAGRPTTEESTTEWKEEIVFLGDQVTDEELNGLLEAGYFGEA